MKQCLTRSSGAAAAFAMRTLLVILLAGLAGCQARPQNFTPREGDLLFQDLDSGPLCDAIEAVTQGYQGDNFSHVGIAASEQGKSVVIEAGGRGVVVTPLARFLSRSADANGHPKVIVGRLKPPYRAAIQPALARAKSLLGKPYDDEFLLDNGKYYCSELVYESFLDPATGKHLFQVFPMTFCPPGSHEPLPAWRDYFAAKGTPIPEGKLGCNPGGLSRSDKLEIVYQYGMPSRPEAN